MKKASFWAGVVGVIILALCVFSSFQFVTHLTNVPLINTALAVTYFLNAAIAVFLIVVSLKGKYKNSQETLELTAGSPEDVTSLKRKRNWIFLMFVLFSVAGSAQMWILNDYTVGLTPLNIQVVLDIVFNFALLVAAVLLLKDKTDKSMFFLSVIALYGVEQMITLALRGQWVLMVLVALITAYFGFAIVAPQTRLNFNLAHLVLLPIIFIGCIFSGSFSINRINELSREAALLQDDFSHYNSNLGSAYANLVQRGFPIPSDEGAILDNKAQQDAVIEKIISNIHDAQLELRKQTPGVSQQELLKKFDYLLAVTDLQKAQGDTAEELYKYEKTILDFYYLPDAQKAHISELEKKVDDYNLQINKKQTELNNANLVY